MSQYNLNPLLVATGPSEDTANAVLLRQDLNTHFDNNKFVFVPKKRIGEEEIPIVTHLLVASRDPGTLHHNVRLKAILDVDISFLFARFATKRPRRRSDSDVEGDTDENERQFKRQKKDAVIVETARCDTSQSIQESHNLVTPIAAEDAEVLRDAWLRIERLRSDMDKAWLEEATRACHTRSND